MIEIMEMQHKTATETTFVKGKSVLFYHPATWHTDTENRYLQV